MKYETLADGSRIPVIGLGTWQMGGGSTPDYTHDAETVAILKQLIDLGYTHLDTAESYGDNHCEELVGQAIQEYDRSQLFITTKVAPEHLRYADVMDALRGSLARLNTDYVDLYLIHWPNRDIPLKETFRALNELVVSGYVKHVGVSNFDVALMREAVDLSDTPLATNQVHYNLLSREMVKNGVLAFCQENGIVLTAYSPLKDTVLEHPVVKEIARAHDATPAQIAIKWLIDQPKVITIPKSSNISRAQENLNALSVDLSADETTQLDALTES